MKIQLQNNLFYPSIGGIENYLYYTAKTLVEMGHEPTILCSKHLKNLPIESYYENIKIIRHSNYENPLLKYTTLHHLIYTYKLQNYLKNQKFQYDGIWARILFEAYASGNVFKGKIPIIYIHAAIAPTLNLFSVKNESVIKKIHIKFLNFQDYYLEKKALNLCDKIVVLSESRHREVSEYYKLDKEKFEVIPPGVDLNIFQPSPKNISLLSELNIPLNSKVILTVCRLSKEKNLGVLINVVKTLKNDKIFLIIVGDGPEKIFLERLATNLGVSSNIKFVGIRYDIAKFYSIADVFVLPSLYEGFGQVFLEAMAAGVPCIGMKSDYPKIIVATDEIIKHDKTGYLVDPYSLDDLSEKIEKIIFDATTGYKFRIESRKICEINYTWEKSVTKLIKLTNKVTETK